MSPDNSVKVDTVTDECVRRAESLAGEFFETPEQLARVLAKELAAAWVAGFRAYQVMFLKGKMGPVD